MKHVLFTLILLQTAVISYSQNYPPVSFTSNFINPRLLVFEENSKKLQDSLLKVYLPNFLEKDSISISAILSYELNSKTISIWKLLKNNALKEIQLFSFDGKNINSEEKTNFYEIINGFDKLKIEVFRELLFANGKSDFKSFDILHEKTRGNFGLLNISKIGRAHV